MARTGWFNQVHVRSEASERIRVLIGTRERLIKMRKDLEGYVRGVLKVFGICMSGVHRENKRQGFRDQLTKAGALDPAIGVMADMFGPIHLALCSAASAMDVELRAIARESGLAERLMTVPGVGPIVTLAFISTLDDATRFKKSKDVGAFLGLTPRRYQSGELDWSGRISKYGDRDLRRLLYSAATTLITQVKKPSPLLIWATRLNERKGFKKPPSQPQGRSQLSCIAFGATRPSLTQAWREWPKHNNAEHLPERSWAGSVSFGTVAHQARLKR
ncbi:transposase [Tateyamaria sp.]|uniref:transposase n=1 Tax=Tateyamaria sp. TaxID=1929288 RepID=UPI00329B01C2